MASAAVRVGSTRPVACVSESAMSSLRSSAPGASRRRRPVVRRCAVRVSAFQGAQKLTAQMVGSSGPRMSFDDRVGMVRNRRRGAGVGYFAG